MTPVNKNIQSSSEEMVFLISIPFVDQLFLGHHIEIIIQLKKLIPIKDVILAFTQKFLFLFYHLTTSILSLSFRINKNFLEIEGLQFDGVERKEFLFSYSFMSPGDFVLFLGYVCKLAR